MAKNPSLEFQQLYLKECTSTNDFVKDMDGSQSEWAVYTFNQTQGKGQREKKWISEPHKNIALSLSIPKEKIEFSRVLLSMAVANLSRHFIQEFLPQSKVTIKWPNDIFVKDKKIAGILIEETNESYVVGIGINVNSTAFIHLPHATSIQLESTQAIDLKEITQLFIQSFESLLPLVEEEIAPLYHFHLYGKNTTITFKIHGQITKGKILKVDELGNLHLLDMELGKTLVFKNGELEYLL